MFYILYSLNSSVKKYTYKSDNNINALIPPLLNYTSLTITRLFDG